MEENVIKWKKMTGCATWSEMFGRSVLNPNTRTFPQIFSLRIKHIVYIMYNHSQILFRCDGETKFVVNIICNTKPQVHVVVFFLYHKQSKVHLLMFLCGSSLKYWFRSVRAFWCSFTLLQGSFESHSRSQVRLGCFYRRDSRSGHKHISRNHAVWMRCYRIRETDFTPFSKMDVPWPSVFDN